jgi:hypothetical protein
MSRSSARRLLPILFGLFVPLLAGCKRDALHPPPSSPVERPNAAAIAALPSYGWPSLRGDAAWLKASTEDERMRILEALEARPCLDYIYNHDHPVKGALEPAVAEEALRLCRGQGVRAEAARSLARDAEQRHAISLCAAAYSEYEMFVEERLDLWPQGHPKRAQAVYGLLETCKGRLHDLGR